MAEAKGEKMAVQVRWLAWGMVVLSLSFSAAYAQRADSLQALLPHSKDTTRVIILTQLAHELRAKDNTLATAYANEAVELARSLGFTKGEAMATMRLAVTYGFRNDFDQALTLLRTATDLAIETKQWKLAADCYINCGGIYSARSNTKKAFENYREALTYFEKANDKSGQATASYGIGITYVHEKKFDQALEYYNRSIALFNELGQQQEVPKVLVNVGTMYFQMKDYPQALNQLSRAIDIFRSFKNERGAATALHSRAEVYDAMQQHTPALADLEEAMVLNEKNQHEYNKVKCALLFAKIYRQQKKYDLAKEKLQQSIAISQKIKLTEDTSEAYRLLAEISSDQADFKNAYRYHQLHRVYYDSVFDKEKSRQIQEMQIAFETEKKEAEIRVLKSRQILNQTLLYGSLTLLAMVVAIAFLLLNRQRLKNKKEKELAEKESQLMEERKALMEAEIENARLSQEGLKQEIEFKNKELTTYTLNLIQKNEVLENIKAAVEEIRLAEDSQIRSRLNSLLNTVNYSFHLDKDWENFRLHFEQVHQSFFDRLNELYPDLSPNDRKLCALIRLNLDTKETAAVLDISPESAKVARHRLRKKLNLAPEQNLASFLAAI